MDKACQKINIWLLSVVLFVCDIPPELEALILCDPQTSMVVKGQLGVDIWWKYLIFLSVFLIYFSHFSRLYFLSFSYVLNCLPFLLSSSLTSIPLSLNIFYSNSSVALKWTNISFTNWVSCSQVCKRDVAQKKILLCFCAKANIEPDKQMYKNVWVNQVLCF